MKKKGNHLITILLVLIFLLGLSLLLYPAVSDYWNSKHQTRAIAVYSEEAPTPYTRYRMMPETIIMNTVEAQRRPEAFTL